MKSNIIGDISRKTGLPPNQAELAMEAALESIMEGVRGNGKVSLAGFGTFKRVERKARTGRNAQTGSTVYINASNTVKFIPGNRFKEAIQNVPTAEGGGPDPVEAILK